MTPIIFLDIDGVLNGHPKWGSGDPLIDASCVKRLNDILERTGAKIVISSAWRYQILGKEITLRGFQYMLISHGMFAGVDVIGHTRSDEEITEAMGGRATQILAWIDENRHVGPWVVLDDLPLGDVLKEYHVRTDPSEGLIDSDVDKAVAIIERKNFWPES
jgi:hypothetical protein